MPVNILAQSVYNEEKNLGSKTIDVTRVQHLEGLIYHVGHECKEGAGIRSTGLGILT
jgi:hypothetical protein